MTWVTLSQLHAAQRAKVHATFDKIILEIQQERREALARLEAAIAEVERDLRAQQQRAQSEDDDG
jgi:ribosome-associated translation inhibitor RaiA